MTVPIQPIVLLADSQLLFWSRGGEPLLERLRALIDEPRPRAAYVGASNGDRPEFYQLFEGAMEGAGIEDCRMIPSEPEREDLRFFDRADLILLAGGDVRQGWRTMKNNGIRQKVVERYYTGALLIGVSAGAVQLGLHGIAEKESGAVWLYDTFKLVPLLVDVHAEPDWARLATGLRKAEEDVRGLGIQSGGGAILHPDLTLEAVRRPLIEFSREPVGVEDGVQDGVRQALLFPPEGDGGEEDGGTASGSG